MVVFMTFAACSVGARAQCTTANSVGALRNALIPSTGPAPYDKYMNGLQSNSASSSTSVASVPVTISAALHMVHEVDAAKGTVTVFMTHRMSWLDGRLKYCTTSAVPYPKIKFDADFVDEIWTPEYAVPNQISTVQDPQSYATVRGSDGMVYLDTTVGMKLACTLDFKKMPYDSQTCAARVALVQQKDILELKLDDTLPEAFFLETGGMGGTKEWKISELSATVGETLDNATYVDFVFVIDRSSDYWLTFTIGPSVFLVVMSYGTFWIQRGAVPARAAFSFICFLSIISLSNGALAKLPSIGADDAFLLKLLSSCSIFCGLTVIEVVIANYMLHVEIRVTRALTQAEEKKARGDADFDIQAFVRARCAKLDALFVASSGRLRFSDQHIDVLARWAFPIAFGVTCVSLRASFV